MTETKAAAPAVQTAASASQAVQDAVKAAQAVTFPPEHMRHLGVEDHARWAAMHAAWGKVVKALGL